jgi:hypothetical protein
MKVVTQVSQLKREVILVEKDVNFFFTKVIFKICFDIITRHKFI